MRTLLRISLCTANDDLSSTLQSSNPAVETGHHPPPRQFPGTHTAGAERFRVIQNEADKFDFSYSTGTMSAMPTSVEAQAKELFKIYDVNKDKVLSPAEMLVVLKALKGDDKVSYASHKYVTYRIATCDP